MRSRLLAVSVVAIAMSLIAPAAFAVQTRATVDDVIKMWQSEMSGADIVAFIEREGVYAALSQEDIARLEEAGVPARLVVAVDRSFTQMATPDRQRTEPQARRERSRWWRPASYGRPYYGPYYSPWHTDIGFSFGHGGFGHGGFGSHGGGHRGGHGGRH